MTLHRQKDELTFECDTCQDFLFTDTKYMSGALGVLQSNQWRAIKRPAGQKLGDSFAHFCNKCKMAQR